LVQAFLKKWWVESDIKAPNLPLSLRFKGSAVTITVFKYRSVTIVDGCEEKKSDRVKAIKSSVG
jgi:hypothetical protein